jgi:hypothetical protein
MARSSLITEELAKEMARLYKDGRSIRSIKGDYPYGYATIHRALKSQGVQMRKIGSGAERGTR